MSLTTLPTEGRVRHQTATPYRARESYSTSEERSETGGIFVRSLVDATTSSIVASVKLLEHSHGFDLSTLDQQLTEHAQKHGVDLSELLSTAGRHFDSDAVPRRLTPLTADELDALAEDDEWGRDAELSSVVR